MGRLEQICQLIKGSYREEIEGKGGSGVEQSVLEGGRKVGDAKPPFMNWEGKE